MNKEYIIKEINRTAKENKGIPLGEKKFTAETGIKKADWHGKYWTKWSDALVEAGYTPNKMNSAYDESGLIEQVISLIREIKKLPATVDFKIKAFKTGNFPSHNTFRSRLGNKYELANKIMIYCKDKSEYLDVIDICKGVSNTLKPETEHYSKEIDFDFGYVYLMKSGHFYKIGSSKCVERRNYELGIKLPETLKIMHKIKTDDPTEIENYWHSRFKD